jgi:predicted negative regulator of RcsB-dependent stress response
MVEIYDAHEQGEAVKKWLQENGSAMVVGLVIAFGGLFGFKQWQAWEVNQMQSASAEFRVLSDMLSDGQLDEAMSNYQNLQDNYSSSPYAALGALQMARARLEADQVDLAVNLYRFVSENASTKAIRIVGAERLARVLLDQGQADEAMQVLNSVEDIGGFESRFAEVRGDIHFAQGRNDEAVAAWLEALDTLEAGTGDPAMLELKIESLGAEIPEEDGSAS